MQPPSNTPAQHAQPAIAHPLEVRERGFKLYCESKTLPQISEALAVPMATIAGWSSRGKWKARRILMNTPPPPKEPVVDAGTSDVLPPEPPPDYSGLSFEEKQKLFRDGFADISLNAMEAIKLLPAPLVIAAADKIAKLHSVGQKSLDLEKSAPSVIVNVGLLGRGVVQAHLMSGAEKPILLADSDSRVTAAETPTYEGDTGIIPAADAHEVAP